MEENSLLVLLNQPDLLEDYLIKYFSNPIDLFRIYINDPRFKDFIDKKEIFRKLELYKMPNDRWRILATEIAGQMWTAESKQYFVDKNNYKNILVIGANFAKREIFVVFQFKKDPKYVKDFVSYFDLKQDHEASNKNRYILKGTQLIRAIYKCFSDGLRNEHYSEGYRGSFINISSCITCKSDTQTMCKCCNSPCCSKACLNKIH